MNQTCHNLQDLKNEMNTFKNIFWLNFTHFCLRPIFFPILKLCGYLLQSGDVNITKTEDADSVSNTSGSSDSSAEKQIEGIPLNTSREKLNQQQPSSVGQNVMSSLILYT